MGVNKSDVGRVEIEVQAGTGRCEGAGRERWIDMTESRHVGRNKGAVGVCVCVCGRGKGRLVSE